MKAWNDAPQTNIRYARGNITTSTTGLWSADGNASSHKASTRKVNFRHTEREQYIFSSLSTYNTNYNFPHQRSELGFVQ